MAALKPQDFLISARDFFAVIVPGAIFLLLLPDRALAQMQIGTSGAELLAFAIAAYLAGSVFSALGSGLDLVVDPLLQCRKFRAFGLFPKLRRREALADKLRRQLIAECPCPISLKEHPESVKAFWWNHLRLNCPAAMVELDRIEATQKLFRSLAPVFGLLAVLAVPSVKESMGASFSAGVQLDPGLSVLAAGIAAAFYIGGRMFFLSAVYRLGAAFCLRDCLIGLRQ